MSQPPSARPPSAGTARLLALQTLCITEWRPPIGPHGACSMVHRTCSMVLWTTEHFLWTLEHATWNIDHILWTTEHASWSIEHVPWGTISELNLGMQGSFECR